MDVMAKIKNLEVVDESPSFRVQVCSDEGRLLREYGLTRVDNNVSTFDAAEDYVRSDFSNYKGAPLVVLVSQETLTKLRQLQIKVVASVPDAA